LSERISVHVGEVYDSAEIERDVKTLKSTGYFDDVRAVVKDDSARKNGKMITFFVREKKIVLRPKPVLPSHLRARSVDP
jgi:outer membrane protein assembly factor BamA